ncbi:glycosyltransferase [Falsihalocynthiibacter sp. S25ZX9]|uniref:glycosyltransferase n=1 Tax=Falsihalocynthiibacter sp. S25ZX9 TaxID=3240870 RepID=UPI0035103E42
MTRFQPHETLAIVAPSFNQPSETFIRNHVRTIAPESTVLICENAEKADEQGLPVLGGIGNLAATDTFAGFLQRAFRWRWRKYVDARLQGQDKKRIISFLQAHNVVRVLAEFGPMGCRVAAATTQLGIPLFVHFHGYDATSHLRDARWRRHYRQLFREASGIIVPSQFLAVKLIAAGCPEDLISVSANGIDLDCFEPSTQEAGRVLAVGRLVEKKAPHLSLQAFAQVREVLPEAHLDLVGDGPLRETCEAEIDRLEIRGNVTIHGMLSSEEVLPLFGKAAVFIQHSVTAPNGDTESFGISLVEAMASGIPVIVTRHNGFPETVGDGETGVLVDEHDVDSMARSMIEILTNPERAEAMGRAGIARAANLFSSDIAAQRLRRIMDITL